MTVTRAVCCCAIDFSILPADLIITRDSHFIYVTPFPEFSSSESVVDKRDRGPTSRKFDEKTVAVG